jgi:hypothetical protein
VVAVEFVIVGGGTLEIVHWYRMSSWKQNCVKTAGILMGF